MKKGLSALCCVTLVGTCLSVFGCASVMPASDSYKRSDAYFIEVRDNEDPLVMEYFYQLNGYLRDGDFNGVIEAATDGIDAIPKYRELFSYFYAMRAYAAIMLYRLDKGREDIENLTRFDDESSMIPGLWSYYYFSCAPFDPNPKDYYLKAKESVVAWRKASPKNTFEVIFSDPTRIAELEKVIDDELRK